MQIIVALKTWAAASASRGRPLGPPIRCVDLPEKDAVEVPLYLWPRSRSPPSESLQVRDHVAHVGGGKCGRHAVLIAAAARAEPVRQRRRAPVM